MPLYNYIARDKQGNIKKGEIEADSEKKLAAWLYDQGFLLTRFEEKGQRSPWFFWDKIFLIFGRVSLMEKVLFTRYLEVMLKAGLSLVKALKILVNQTENRKFKKVVTALHHDVETGSPFYEALAKHPTVFSQLYVNVIKTGELSGKMDLVLGQLAVQLKKDRDLVKKVTGAMIYPAVVLVAMGGIGFLMMTFVLPKLVSVFEEFNTTLPLPTRILILVSKSLGQYAFWVIGGLLIFGVGLIKFIRSKAGRKIFHRLYLRLPVISRIVKKLNLARFVRNLSSLLGAGLPILKCLDIGADALGNIYYQRAIKAAMTEVQKGLPLSRTLGRYPRLFPPIVTQVMEVGEETGALEDILVNLADFYEQDVDQTMKNISTIVEPLLMLVMGGAVGAMAISIILPIYTLTSNL